MKSDRAYIAFLRKTIKTCTIGSQQTDMDLFDDAKSHATKCKQLIENENYTDALSETRELLNLFESQKSALEAYESDYSRPMYERIYDDFGPFCFGIDIVDERFEHNLMGGLQSLENYLQRVTYRSRE